MKTVFSISLLIVSALIGCSREQTMTAANVVSKTYIESNRDNVIGNWQAKVAGTPACAEFKIRFKTAGERYDSAMNGAFVNDMMKIWEATKAANCAAPV